MKSLDEVKEGEQAAKNRLTDQEIKSNFPYWRDVAEEKFQEYTRERESIITDLAFNLMTLKDDCFDDEYIGPLRKIDRKLIADQLQSEAEKRLRWLNRQCSRLHTLLRKPPKKSPPRIDSGDIEAARAFPCQDLLPHLFKRLGRNLVALCPLHEERHGSFTIFPDNRWKCFGCGKFGDAIGLYRIINPGVGFVETVRALAGRIAA